MHRPGFYLLEASAPERTARDRLTFEAWGSRLSRDQYLERERRLRQTWHARLGMHSWVLKVPNNTVLASCETFRLPLLSGGDVEVIASVFVDRPLRGAGMATRLLNALVERRREAGIDALLLFSEVGPTIYERSGFRLLPAPTRSAPARPHETPGVERLPRARLGELLALRRRLREGRIDLALGEEIVDWHLERACVYADALGCPPPRTVGATDGRALVVWTPDRKNDLLRVLDASGPAGHDLGPLLDAAADEAHRLGLSGMELWDDAHSLALEGGLRFQREDDLPMGQSFTPRGELFLGPLSRAAWA